MNLYHVTFREYKPDCIVTINQEQNYHRRASLAGHGWVETTLAKYKPEKAPERTDCVYAFSSLIHCMGYIQPMLNGRTPIYYEVEMENFWSAPMVLVDHVRKAGQNANEDHLSTISAEYWESLQKWKFIEYFSEQMKILKRVEPPTEINNIPARMLTKIDYNSDIEIAKNIG